MFEGLIVSNRERRKRRTLKYFIGTSMTYGLVVTTAMVISVVAADPELIELKADSDRRLIVDLSPRLGTTAPPAGRQAPQITGPNIYNPLEYDHLGTGPAPGTSHSTPPGPQQIDAAGNGGVPWGVPEGADPNVGLNIDRDAPNAPPPQPADRNPSASQQTNPRIQLVRVPSIVLQGKATSRITPEYPPLAKQIRLEGTVAIEIIISPEGVVESVRIVSGHPILAAAAEKAARGWRFEPTLLNKVPVRATGVITFVFRLNQ